MTPAHADEYGKEDVAFICGMIPNSAQQMLMDYIITTDKLCKFFGRKDTVKEAVKDVSIKVREGEIYGLIGRNGAGKTTLMKMLCGLSTPTKGSVSLFGKTGGESKKEMRNIGSLIEAPGVYPYMNAKDNIRLKCLALGVDRPGYPEELLETVGLSDVGKKKVGQFSLGMVQRLGIALALVGDPKILILDEPINGLDPQGIAECRRIFSKLKKEKKMTILISSHILDELGKFADSYGIIHEGKLIDQFTHEELKERSGHYTLFMTDDNRKAFQVMDKMGVEKISQTRSGMIRVDDDISREKNIVKALVENDVFVEEVRTKSFSLEEYYLSITGGDDDAE